MAEYVPFAGKNSIVEAVFGLQFSQPLTSLIATKFDALQTEFSSDFPKFEKMQMLQFTFGVPQQSETPVSSPVIGGFNASRFKPDGKASRVLRSMNNTLSAHFLEYDSWAATKADALRFLNSCFKVLDLPTSANPITAVSLRFIDRFTFDGPADRASASSLMRLDTDYVARIVLERGGQWQSQSVWTKELSGGQVSNHQLNIHSGVDSNAFVLVNHNVHLNLPAALSTHDEVLGKGSKSSLEEIFNAQHTSNVDLLQNLLNPDMLNSIGLEVEAT